jgi:hypothetical protein
MKLFNIQSIVIQEHYLDLHYHLICLKLGSACLLLVPLEVEIQK